MSMNDSRWTCQDLTSSIEQVKSRNKLGIRCIMDPLGALARDDEASIRSNSDYLALISSINTDHLHASISIKPTALGAAYDEHGCALRITNIATAAWDVDVTVEIDMEGRKYLEFTVEIARRLARSNRGSISIALQAYMHRTIKDIRDLSRDGARVRLVKGTYSGDIEEFAEVQSAMSENIEVLHSLGRPFAIGTHDPIIIGRLVKDRSMKGLVEIGMLKGLGDETKTYLAGRGWSVAEYVPFGSDPQAYIVRRENYLRKMSGLGKEPCP